MKIFNRVIYGVDGEHETPYVRQVQFGRLRLHMFYRGDADPDYHDHPWWFITFPLTSYLEEVYHPDGNWVETRIVKRFHFHYRSAKFAHRLICRIDKGQVSSGRVYTVVWRGSGERDWGFWRPSCPDWIPWRHYVYEGGKHAACEE